MRTNKPEVALLFRKRGSRGYYSIERSFERIEDIFRQATDLNVRRVTAGRLSKGVLNRLRILLQFFRLRAAVFHITGDIHFAALVTPRNQTILTVHDCGFLEHPNPVLRAILRLLWLRWPVHRSRWVTTVSEHSKSAIVRHTGCPPEKIIVIPSVVPEQFQSRPLIPFRDPPHFLHIGSGAHKNLLRHIEALSTLPCFLQIVAQPEQKAVALLDRYGIPHRWTPDLADTAVVEAYENCDILLFASTSEGFGMPILEAQSIGKPVVTSNCSSMPEVAGKGAVLVDPYDVESIRGGILRLLNDTDFRKDLIRLGFENARRFQPAAIAAAYLHLYRDIIQNN